jgi:hypothetical protein
MVGDVQGAEGEERGVLGAFFFFPPFLTAWVGAEGAGVDRGDLHEHGYRLKTNGNSDAHSSSDFLDFFFCQVFGQMPARNSNSNF